MKKVILTQSLSAAGTIHHHVEKLPWGPDVSVHATYDDYSHGPLVTDCDVEAFFEERNSFWEKRFSFSNTSPQEHFLEESFWPMVSDSSEASRVEIWTTSAVREVFFTITTTTLLVRSSIDASKIGLRVFEGEGSKDGLWFLDETNLANAFHKSSFEPVDLQLIDRAWEAISSGAAERIDTFSKTLTTETWLRLGLEAYLTRFPEFNKGLGSIDRALLGSATSDFRKAVYTVGPAMWAGQVTGDVIGDNFLFDRLVKLANLSPEPWFEIEGETGAMRFCNVKLTEEGQKIREQFAVKILR